MVGFRPDLHHGVGGRTVAARSVRGLISKAARALRALIRTARAPLRASSVSRAQRCGRRGAARPRRWEPGRNPPAHRGARTCTSRDAPTQRAPGGACGLRRPRGPGSWSSWHARRASGRPRTAQRRGPGGSRPTQAGNRSTPERLPTKPSVPAPPPQAGQHPGGRPLTDVGSCRGLTRDTGTYTFLSSGTMPYMAPELWAGRPATVKGDRCALGILTCEVAPGSTPAMAATSEPCGAGTSRTVRRAASRTAHRARSVTQCSNCSRRTRETSVGRLCRRRCPEFAVASPRGWHSGRADVPSDLDGGGH